jgi:hypothetical protein
MDHEDIAGVAAEGRLARTRGGSYWAYRTIGVGKDGQKVPLGDWRRENLLQCNAEAARLAQVLDCESYAAPACSTVQVLAAEGKTFVTFVPPSGSFSRDMVWRLVLLLAFLLLGWGLAHVMLARR